MNLSNVKKNMLKGSPARLFPVLADSKKEERATSILLATFSVVPDFARDVLTSAGAPIGKRSTITCFTEVSFKGMSSNCRPDGLILVTSGNKSWAALVESKVGNATLTADQIEPYLDIAREQGLDAVITISNQFTALPSHHPVKVNKTKTRSISLFHFSWMALTSSALMLVQNKSVSDSEQSYILSELIRYFEHESSGTSSNLKMSSCWKQTCLDAHQGSKLNKNSDAVLIAVADWFQLLRYVSIKLSLALGQTCTVSMTRNHSANPQARLQESASELANSLQLVSEIEIPNAAGKVRLSVSLLRKTLDLSVNLETPKDVKQQRAAINFVLSQLKACDQDELIVRVNWPRRIPSTQLSITKALDEDDRKELIPPNVKDLPSSVDLIFIVDLGARLKSSGNFPLDTERELINFYKNVVQNLQRWTPKAPKVKAQKNNLSEQGDELAVEIISKINQQDDEINSKSEASFRALPRFTFGHDKID